MSEQNKDKQSREEWLKHEPSSGENTGSDFPLNKSPEAWDAIARRGRSLLKDEAEAEDLLRGLDDAIDRQFGESGKKIKPLPVRNRYRWVAIAAGILLVVSAAWWIWSPAAEHNRLYQQYFTHLENQLTVSLMGDTESNELTEVLRPYNARRYAEAADRIGNYLTSHNEPAALRLYYGISLLESGAVSEAIDQFVEVNNTLVTSNYTKTADWYLALAYLKLDQIATSKLLLHEIAQSQHPYAAQAQNLLEALK